MVGKAATKQGKAARKQPRGSNLTPKQAAFAAEYLKDFNATQAAIRAGYAPKSARVEGSRLLTHPAVAALVAPKREEAVTERAEAINRMALSAERTRLEIARLAYFDPRKLFNPDGSPKAITELDDDTAAAIAGLDVLEERDSEGMLTGHVKKWKIADKNAALEKAAKIAGLYEADNNQSRPTVQVVMVPSKEASK